jgi:hypothetical protein
VKSVSRIREKTFFLEFCIGLSEDLTQDSEKITIFDCEPQKEFSPSRSNFGQYHVLLL